MHHSQKKKLTDTVPQEIQTMELPKTAYAQRTKETKKTISQQMENSNKETEIIKSNDTWELKSTKTEMKNSLADSVVDLSWPKTDTMNLNID